MIHQGHLEQTLRGLFVENVITNTRKEAVIVNPRTGYFLELDLWIPSLNICFEFQDTYHYITTWDSQAPLSQIKEKDALKGEAVHARGGTLILVPCWWDGQEKSLVEAIRFARPDLLPTYKPSSKSIPLNPPLGFFKLGTLPGVGELMLASFPQFQQFNDSISTENSWWLGEKYDGVRCCWSARNKILYSRSGLEIDLLVICARLLPEIYLDGELWFGRGGFSEAQKLVHSISSVGWTSLRIIVFDKPDVETQALPFEQRYAILLDKISAMNPFLIIAWRGICSESHLLQFFMSEVIEDGGEGVIMRRPASLYEKGRSSSLVKLKAFRADQEALVEEAHQGSVLLKLPNGYTFEVENWDLNVTRGDVVTFTYENLSSHALPINPQLLRVRGDVTWEQVLLQNSQIGIEKTQSAFDTHKTKRMTKRRHMMRNFFENFAKSEQFDPLIALNWYRVSRKKILQTKRGRYIIGFYKGSLVNALVDLFPEVRITPSKFSHIPKRHWQNMENRNQFFAEFAKSKGFDPLIPENWYQVETTSILSTKGSTALRRYKNNRRKALLHVFPDIGLDSSQLMQRQYKQEGNRRQFFVNFAKSKGLDPLIARNWYSITASNIMNSKGGATVLSYYKGNYAKALTTLFPNIGLQEGELTIHSKNFWADANNQRDFFVDFARKESFDPLHAKSWDNVKTRDFLMHTGSSAILQYYKSFSKALKVLFPEVELEKTKHVC